MTSENDQISRALKYLSRLERPRLSKAEKPPELLSRHDVRLKLAELRESISTVKQSTFDKLASSPYVSHLVIERLPAAIAKKFLTPSEPDATVITREKTISIVNSTRRLTSLDRTAEAIDASVHFDQTESASMMHSITGDSFDGLHGDAKTSLNTSYDLTYQGLQPQDHKTFTELKNTEEDLMEKLRFKVRKSTREPLAQLKSCKSYVLIRCPAYEDEMDWEMFKHFAEIDFDEFRLKYRAIDPEAYMVYKVSKLVLIIDTMLPREFKLIFDDETTIGVHLKLLTDEDLAKWRQLLRNLSQAYHIQISNTGKLPIYQGDPNGKDFKRRVSTVWARSMTMMDSELGDTDAEIKNLKVTQDFQFHSWNTEEDREVEKLNESGSLTSESSTSQLMIDDMDDRVRNLTSMASLGRAEGLVNLLTKGGVFLKYGRRGRPHLRHVYVTADLKTIEWRPLDKPPYGSNKHQAVASGLRIQLGRSTPVFRRFPNIDRESESFSVIFKKRSLDLELCKENVIPREVWVESFTQLIEQKFNRDQVKRFIAKSKKRS
mmetsp:Transcript_17305/g.31174  ORF Transcript_17305/g.31174 Transcript_17305/m.31174 type:complete len:546 (-) Transcript_17305:99-1736(-)